MGHTSENDYQGAPPVVVDSTPIDDDSDEGIGLVDGIAFDGDSDEDPGGDDSTPSDDDSDEGPDIVVDASSQDNNLTDIQKRTQNMLLNPKEQVKKAVEKGQIKITDTEKKIFDAAAEVVDTTPSDNNSDEGPVVVDTSSQDNIYDVAPDIVVDTSSQDNIYDVAPDIVVDASSQDNNLTDIQKRTQNMLLNPKEQVKKAVEKGQIKITDTEKKIFDAAAEVVDTTPSDNNFDAPPDNRKEEVPEPATPPATPPARPSGAAEAANKYKRIIQLAVVAVAIAGTLGAYVWRKN